MRGVLPVSPQEEARNAVGWVRSGQPRERDYGLHTPDRRGEATDFGWRQQPDWSAAGRVSDAVVGPSSRRFSLWNTHQTQLATAAGHTAAKRLRGRRGRRVEVPTWLVSGGGACSVYVLRIGRGSGTPSGSTNDRAPSPKRANPLACVRWETVSGAWRIVNTETIDMHFVQQGLHSAAGATGEWNTSTYRSHLAAAYRRLVAAPVPCVVRDQPKI